MIMKILRIAVLTLLVALTASAADVVLLSLGNDSSSTFPSAAPSFTNSPPLFTNSPRVFTSAPPVFASSTPVTNQLTVTNPYPIRPGSPTVTNTFVTNQMILTVTNGMIISGTNQMTQ